MFTEARKIFSSNGAEIAILLSKKRCFWKPKMGFWFCYYIKLFHGFRTPENPERGTYVRKLVPETRDGTGTGMNSRPAGLPIDRSSATYLIYFRTLIIS